MVVYIDLVCVLNFIFDGTLLLTVDLMLKRNTSRKRIIFGALLGELSMISLFIEMGRISNFIFKIVLSLIMSIGAFSYKSIKYTCLNVVYLYLAGIILGGFEYYLFNEFSIGSLLSREYLLIVVLSPIVLAVYYYLVRKMKTDYNNRFKVKIVYMDEVFEGIGYLDSGNKLISPINGKIIVLVEKEYIRYHKLKLYPVAYHALNYHGLLYCFTPKEVFIDDKRYDNVAIGLAEDKFNIDGCNVLLNARMEGL